MNPRTLILKRFKEVGLTSYEARSYLSLLERDTLTVAEVSKIAEIPRANAYEALEKLMAKGMCIAKPGETKRYSASDPALLEGRFLGQLDQATKMKIQNLKTDVETKEKQILEKAEGVKTNIAQMMRELRPRYEDSRLETNPLDYIEIIKDPYQIHKRYMELLKNLREEHLAIVKGPFTGPPEKLKEQIDIAVDILKRGISFREIWEPPGDHPERRWLREFMECLVKHGAEVRIAEVLPMKTTIFDSRIVVFALADPVSKQLSLTSQITEHPAFAHSLKILFEFLWGQAQDYHIWKG
jgi:sugar-specific transcriptional regulator TrmB